MIKKTIERRVERLKSDLVDAAIAREGVDGDGVDGTLAQRAALLERHYLTRTPDRRKWARCTITAKEGCGYVSTYDQKACPFCGLEDPPDNSAMPVTSASPSAADEAAATIVVPAPDDVDAQSEALAVTGDAPLAAARLDAAVDRVRRAQADYQGATWDLGKALKDVKDADLWMERRDGTGHPLYASWKEFLAAESNIKPQYAAELIAIASVFSREQAVRIGSVERSRHVLRLLEGDSEAARARRDKLPEIIEHARAVPVSVLIKEVRETVPEAPQRNPGARTAAATKAAAAKRAAREDAPARQDDRLTVVTPLGLVALDMFVGGKGKPAAHAKKEVAVGCFAVEKFGNGVERVYRVAREGSRFVLVIETSRAT